MQKKLTPQQIIDQKIQDLPSRRQLKKIANKLAQRTRRAEKSKLKARGK
jgi:hypothetical protein